MTILQKVAQVSNSIECATRSGEFCAVARYITLAGELGGALRLAEADELSPRVISILKTATTVGALSSWGSTLGEFSNVVAAFLDTLKNVSAFDTLLPSMRTVPFRSRVVITSAGATGAVVAEGHVTQISTLAFNGVTTEQQKALAVIVLNDELLKFGAPGTADLFGRELRAAVATVTDQAFIAAITGGITPIPSSGGNADAISADFKAALDTIAVGAQSKVFAITTSSIAKSWATMIGVGGVAFPQMTISGGVMFGVPIVVSDGVVAGEIVFVDAASIVASAGAMEIGSSRHTILQMNSTPELAADRKHGAANIVAE